MSYFALPLRIVYVSQSHYYYLISLTTSENSLCNCPYMFHYFWILGWFLKDIAPCISQFRGIGCWLYSFLLDNAVHHSTLLESYLYFHPPISRPRPSLGSHHTLSPTSLPSTPQPAHLIASTSQHDLLQDLPLAACLYLPLQSPLTGGRLATPKLGGGGGGTGSMMLPADCKNYLPPENRRHQNTAPPKCSRLPPDGPTLLSQGPL